MEAAASLSWQDDEHAFAKFAATTSCQLGLCFVGWLPLRIGMQ
jgi:hypothetical protein